MKKVEKISVPWFGTKLCQGWGERTFFRVYSTDAPIDQFSFYVKKAVFAQLCPFKIDFRTTQYEHQVEVSAPILESILCLLDGRPVPESDPKRLLEIHRTVSSMDINQHLLRSLEAHCDQAIVLPSMISRSNYIQLILLAEICQLEKLTRRMVAMLVYSVWDNEVEVKKWSRGEKKAAGRMFFFTQLVLQHDRGTHLTANWRDGQLSLIDAGYDVDEAARVVAVL